MCEAFQSATEELRKVKRMEGLLLSGKIKATQVKEEIRNVTHRLASQPETYGRCLGEVCNGHEFLADFKMQSNLSLSRFVTHC